MTNLKAKVKEAAGYIEEEAGELVGSEDTANDGRKLRNEGRIEGGKAPKLTKPGTTDTEEFDE